VVRSLSLLVVITLLLGCAMPPNTTGAAGSPSADTPAVPLTTEPVTAAPATPTAAATTTTTPAVSIPAQANAAVDQARQAAATKAGVTLADVTVSSVTAVNWPTSALGCPQPGIMYSQLVTPGYKIVVSANGQSFEYHSDRGSHVVTCPAP
jgi:hypothetical protein